MNNSQIEIIFKNYGTNIKNIIRSITGSNNEDIEQEVYIKAWKNTQSYKEEGKMNSWLKTITVNTCKDYFKSRHYKQAKQSQAEEDSLYLVKDFKHCPEKTLSKKERQKAIFKAINALKPKFKEIIILYDIQELSYEEISNKLNCPTGTVKSRLFNARKILQDELKEFM